jgi:hypothetical protein
MRKPVAIASLALALLAVLEAASSYTTSFPLTESPIAESGVWTNGQAVGQDWSNVRTTPGFAFGTQTGDVNFNDSIAVLQGTWTPDQSATATVHTVNQKIGNIFEEVELLLRFSITAHNARGYEFNYLCRSDGTQYVEIVRWNGGFSNWTLLDSQTGPGLHDGDRVKATIVGNTLTTYINNVAVFSVTDSTYANGNPGMGFYLQGSTGLNSDYGFTAYTATGAGPTPPGAPTNLRVIG